MGTPWQNARVPAELIAAAREATGRHDATASELIRSGLATLAGVPAPVLSRGGRPRKTTTPREQTA